MSTASAERDRRLARLQRYASSLLSAYGTLLSLAPVSSAPASSDVDLAQLRATTSVLTTHVDGLLALIREVRLDAFLLGGGGSVEGGGEREGGASARVAAMDDR